MEKIDALAASGLVSSATLAALVARLRRVGVFSAEDEREVYEHALMLLEQAQASAAPDMVPIYAAAREVIEEQLRA